MNNKLNPENPTTTQPTFFQKITRFLSTPKNLLVLVIILLFLVIEGMFDIIEIGMGELVSLTNSIRPQSGPVWKREIKDEIATHQLQEMISETPVAKPQIVEIITFEGLLQNLEQKSELLISKKNFLKIYAQLPYRQAQKIISPYELLRFMQNPHWQHNLIQKVENDLAIYLLDGENQMLKNCHISLTNFTNASLQDAEQISLLENNEEFHGRIIPREDFFKAFNALPANLKIFVINDPMQLIRWNDALTQVAVSRYVIDGAVTIGFQIQTGISSSIVRYQASEIAAARLVEQINKIITHKYLAMPERKKETSEEVL